LCRRNGLVRPDPRITLYPFTSHRGETALINGRCLYYYDTVSSAAQQQGNALLLVLIGIIVVWINHRSMFQNENGITAVILPAENEYTNVKLLSLKENSI